jgi:hypothetical protein
MESSQSRLPTLDKLKASVPENLDASKVAKEWFDAFSVALIAGDVDAVLGLVCADALWKDVLAITWDIRTLDGAEKIRACLHNRLPVMKVESTKWKDFVRFQQPFPDLAWIVGMFDFSTDVGLCTGLFRLVPTNSGEWKAYTIFSSLGNLKAFPEKVGSLRSRTALGSQAWADKRRKELEFAEQDPCVLIVGAGQSALELAARLKCLDVPTLMIEKSSRVGDSWRKRYSTLSLHFPVCTRILSHKIARSLKFFHRVRPYALYAVRLAPVLPIFHLN